MQLQSLRTLIKGNAIIEMANKYHALYYVNKLNKTYPLELYEVRKTGFNYGLNCKRNIYYIAII